MRKTTTKTGLFILFIMMSVLLAACAGGGEAKPTEKEIVIDPNESLTEAPSVPVETPTLRPTQTTDPNVAATEAPLPTNTLNPYETLIFEGVQLRVNEQFDAALAKFGEAIQMDPNLPDAYIERGITYMNTDKYDEAIADYNYAINNDPENAAAYNARGVAWAQKDQYTQAVKDYNKALELDPTFEKAITNLAIASMLQGNFEAGLGYFSQAIEVSPDNAELYFNRGNAYRQLSTILVKPEYIDLCIADFNQVLAFQPNDPNSLANRGDCYTYKKDFEAAYQDYSAAIELDPERANFYLYRAALYPDAGTQAQALSDAQKVLDISEDPDNRKQAELMLTEIPKAPESTPAVATATPAP